MTKNNNDQDQYLLREIEELKEENKILKNRLHQTDKEINSIEKYYNKELEKIDFVRFARLNYYYIKNNGFFNFLWKSIKSVGKIFKILFLKIFKVFDLIKERKQLNEILNKNKGKKIFLFYPGYDWYMKMYQRPQHMAMHFSDANVLFFYCTTNMNDKISGFKKIKDGLYVTNLYSFLKKRLPRYTLYMCANMNGCYLKELKSIEKKGNNVLYEYIDDLHEDLTTISPELLERHKYVLENESIPVVVTAEYLFKKARSIRKSNKNILLSTNGVVYEDFHVTKKLPVPSEIKKIVSYKKPIIGYYGALANWFDYDLIDEMARKHKDWEVLLIGIDYDKSLAKYDYFDYLPNVHYIGPVDYKELIRFGNCCTVLTIPFLINEITLATSPVKVFEYMSMEKPIVTTDLPECRKYKSVMIGKNHGDFIKKVEQAILLINNSDYKKILKNEALENTWDKKAKEILQFIK